MNLLFVKLDKNYINELSKLLVPAGIEFKVINSYLDAVGMIDKDKFSLILQDIDFNSDKKDDISSEKLIKFIRSKNENCSNVVILTDEKDETQLTDYIFNGVLGIIFKSNKNIELAKQFCFILKTIPEFKSGNKRKFVRVKPDADENAFVNFFIPSRGIAHRAKIADLSIKGLTFGGEGRDIPEFIRNGDLFENIELFINNRVVMINGTLMTRGNSTLLMFENVSEQSEKLLCKYVADKIVSIK